MTEFGQLPRVRVVSRRRALQLGAASLAGWPSLSAIGGSDRLPLSRRPEAPDHFLVRISGSARERGRAYGRRFSHEIHEFLETQVYAAFVRKTATRDDMLRYAAACLGPIRKLSVELVEELEGMAEGSGLRLEEQVLLTLHEELWHRGVIPSQGHCTAIAVGPPDTGDKKTYVAQSWDWMREVYGKSQMLLWQRPNGPDVIAYSYPGLWAGAGLNSAGIALCWTSALAVDKSIPGPRVGVPSYVLIAHLLAQPTLEAAAEEARRATHAGWFTFVMADGKGRLMNIEGSPKRLVIKHARGTLSRVYFGTHEMTRTPKGQPVPAHPQCVRMRELLGKAKGHIDLATIQRFYGDHQTRWICKHFNSLDVMIFDCTSRRAYVTRGPGCLAQYKSFSFDGAPG